MKAPRKINKFLEEQGFIFFKEWHENVKNIDALNIKACLEYKKISGYEEINNKYVTLEMSLAYPNGDGDFWPLQPTLLGCLCKDGKSRYAYDKYRDLAWLDIKDIDGTLSLLEQYMLARFDDLLNPDLVISVIDFAMGLEPPPNEFQYLEDMPVPKVKSSSRLSEKAAYFNIAGKYDKTIETLNDPIAQRFSNNLMNKKLLSDAKNKRILS
ncbi:hypothetical protein FACS1894185_0050 [Betaproteobacteria bacterium]|nr:hypothetical protein FACS1894185_0050 [Betaproteobacteria bacterium]